MENEKKWKIKWEDAVQRWPLLCFRHIIWAAVAAKGERFLNHTHGMASFLFCSFAFSMLAFEIPFRNFVVIAIVCIHFFPSQTVFGCRLNLFLFHVLFWCDLWLDNSNLLVRSFFCLSLSLYRYFGCCCYAPFRHPISHISRFLPSFCYEHSFLFAIL